MHLDLSQFDNTSIMTTMEELREKLFEDAMTINEDLRNKLEEVLTADVTEQGLRFSTDISRRWTDLDLDHILLADQTNISV